MTKKKLLLLFFIQASAFSRTLRWEQVFSGCCDCRQWKIQISVSIVHYCSDESISWKICHLSLLEFFPADAMPGEFNELKSYIPEEAWQATDWFENNYVHRGIRCSIMSIIFSKPVWSICEYIENGVLCTPNNTEACWGQILIGSACVVLWITEEFCKNSPCRKWVGMYSPVRPMLRWISILMQDFKIQ